MSLKNNKGFTLLEMLVVIMIMGFLLAMIAPRFAGIFGDSEDTVCDTNIKTTRQYMAGFEMANNKLPNDLINIVNVDSATGDYYGPCEEDPMADGLETFTTAILDRIVLAKHVLSSNEAKELAGTLGIKTLLNYNNEGDAGKTDIFGKSIPGGLASSMQQVAVNTTVNPGLAVMMIGGGNQDGTATTAAAWYKAYKPSKGLFDSNPYDTDAVYAEAADFRWFNRIVVGVGPDCELVTSGYAQAHGICPSYERAASENTAWGYYCVVLPRLAATAAPAPDNDAVTALIVEDASEEGPANPQRITVDVLAPYDKIAEFDVFCPEGHRWPEIAEMWKIVELISS